ncbi:MAG: Uncharacterized protein XD53_1145 [Petrotoga mobilis]|jgi:uncharacterized alkaline shock family protein YloU|nr:MAG: Uncharacterized protein XD53_1145 [Petrotoga mobilis]
MMALNEENDFGEISISENVLKDLVFKSVEDYMKEQKVYNEKIQKDLQKSIKITINDDSSVSVSLKVPAKYGENIVEFSKNIQKAVKDDLEKIAEVYISNIDISIENLVKPEELEEYEEMEEETLENEEIPESEETPENEEKEDEEKKEKNE